MERGTEKRSGAAMMMGKDGGTQGGGRPEGPCEKGRERWSWCPRKGQVTQRRPEQRKERPREGRGGGRGAEGQQGGGTSPGE